MKHDDTGREQDGGDRTRSRRSDDAVITRRHVLQAMGLGGTVTLAGCIGGGGGGGGGPCRDLQIDLSTGTTNFTPDSFGTTDTDWQVTRPNGTTVQGTSIQPISQWVTISSANWIDSEGTGGWPAPSDPLGNYVYETEFEIPDDWEDGQCELRIHEWSVDDSATIELDGPGGTTTLDQATAPGHTTVNGPVTEPVGPGQYTLRARVTNNQTISGLVIHADVFCDCEDDGGEDPCDLSITKEHVGGPVTHGGTADFEITVCNEGDGSCRGGPVTVTDELPAGTTLASSAGNGWNCTENGGVVTCEHPQSSGLGSGDCLPTLTLTLDVGDLDEVGDALVNCATVEQGDSDLPHKRDCVEVPVETGADEECDLAITKSHSGDLVAPGDTTEFEIEVCNVGDGVCAGLVSVVDSLPPGLTFVSASGTGWTTTNNGGTVTCDHQNGGGLAPGDCLPTLTLEVELGAADEVGDAVRNCARLVDDDVNATNNHDCATVPVDTGTADGKCDLSITKRHGGDVVTEGSTTSFEIDVCNVGDGPCEDPVTVVDDLPSGLTFDAASGSGWTVTNSGGSVVFTHPNAGGLGSGECLPTLTLTVQVGAIEETGDQFTNCAYIKGEDVNPENDRDCVTVPVRPTPGKCDLSIDKRHAGGDLVEAGTTTTFQIDVCNAGDGSCDEPVTVVDDLPPGLTFVSASGSGWTVTNSGGVLTCQHSNASGLAPGDCLPTLSLTVQVGSIDETGDQFTNCATIKGSDANPRNDRDCVSVGVTQPKGGCDALEIHKVTGGQFTYGQQETYEITVCNPTGQPCDGQIQVTDDLPGGMTFVSVSGSGWSGSTSGGVVTATHANAGGLAPGDCLPTLTVTVDVAPANQFPGGSDGVQNCAQLIAGGDVVDEDCVYHVIHNV